MAPDAPAPVDVIINASPGIDDALAILAALKCPSIRVLGIATSFSHYVTCEAATRNARGLCIAAGRPDTPIVQGATAPLSTAPASTANASETTATSSGCSSTPTPASLNACSSFLGPDGLAGVQLPSAIPAVQQVDPANGITDTLASTRIATAATGADGEGKDGGEQGAEERRAWEWMCEEVARRPGQITVVQLGPMTNLARALALRPSLASELAGIWVVGGSFFASGDVNAAAEESVFADPEAADHVLTSGANIHVLGLNVTTQVKLTGTDLASLCAQDTASTPAAGEGEHATASSAAEASREACESDHATSPAPEASLVARLVHAYRGHHQQSDHMDGIFLHDACAVAAIISPSLFSFKRGSVRVECTGLGRGCTLMDYSLKK
ncbi:unnamed protein product [Closterium sp. Naga37s-1]|nr:unnamed protein product [Closterium sp. Naga37s-1]